MGRKASPGRIEILRLAGLAGIDPRSARRALLEGPHVLRGICAERAAAAMAELGLTVATAAAPERAA